MKVKKLLKKLESFFDADSKKLEDKKDKIISLLKKLKTEQCALTTKLDDKVSAEKAKLIERKIAIIKRQRQKGLELLKSLES